MLCMLLFCNSSTREAVTKDSCTDEIASLWQGEPMFLSLPGSADAHTVKVNKEKRLIVGLENTMKLLSNEIGKEVPGVVSVGFCWSSTLACGVNGALATGQSGT